MNRASPFQRGWRVISGGKPWVAGVGLGLALVFGILALVSVVLSLVTFLGFVIFLFGLLRPRAAFHVYLFILPFMPLYFGYHKSVYPWGPVNVLDLTTTAIALGILVSPAMRRSSGQRSSLPVFVAVFLICTLFPSLVFLRFLRFVSAVTHYVLGAGVLLFFAATRLLTTPQRLRSAMGVMVISGALAGGLAIIESLYGEGIFRQILPGTFTVWYAGTNWGNDLVRSEALGLLRVHLGMNHPLALGGWLAMLLPLSFAFYASFRRTPNWAGKPNMKGFALAGIVLIATGILLTWSFSVWVGTAVACMVILLYSEIRKHLLPLALPVGLVILLAALWFVTSSGGFALEESAKAQAISHSQHRVRIFRATWAGLSANPLFGEGLEAEKIKGVGGTVGEQLSYGEDMCNAYANLLLRYGLLGLAAFLLLIFALFSHVGRVSLRSDSPEARLFAWALIAMLAGQVVALWAIPWFIGQHGHFFWIMAAIAGRIGLLGEDTSPHSPAGGNR